MAERRRSRRANLPSDVAMVTRPTEDTPATTAETRTRSLYELRLYVMRLDRQVDELRKEVAYLRKMTAGLSERLP